jgi:hypothetical protein
MEFKCKLVEFLEFRQFNFSFEGVIIKYFCSENRVTQSLYSIHHCFLFLLFRYSSEILKRLELPYNKILLAALFSQNYDQLMIYLGEQIFKMNLNSMNFCNLLLIDRLSLFFVSLKWYFNA